MHTLFVSMCTPTLFMGGPFLLIHLQILTYVFVITIICCLFIQCNINKFSLHILKNEYFLYFKGDRLSFIEVLATGGSFHCGVLKNNRSN